MRIKYFGAKVVLVFVTVVATPVVWAALAWPEWSAASPTDDAVIEVASSIEPASVESPVLVQPVIRRRIVVVPRYVYVEATPAPMQPGPVLTAPPPANSPAPLPTPAPAVVIEATIPASQQRQDPVAQQPQQTAAGGSSSGNGGASTSTNNSSAGANQSTSTGGGSSSSRTKGS
jgi:hypothetical protein